jgi:predicted tellurium resistance membrane protein TerC
VQARRRDPLAEFSHRLTQIKFILLEIVIFIGFLMWLWDKAKHDLPFLDSSVGSVRANVADSTTSRR